MGRNFISKRPLEELNKLLNILVNMYELKILHEDIFFSLCDSIYQEIENTLYEYFEDEYSLVKDRFKKHYPLDPFHNFLKKTYGHRTYLIELLNRIKDENKQKQVVEQLVRYINHHIH